MRTEHDSYNANVLDWIVANTHSHREHIALENLHRQGFHTYCPMLRKQLRRRHMCHDVLRPLFPGYLFVQVSSDQPHWRPLFSTYGVRTLICFGERLATVDDDFIQSLRAREVGGVIARPERPFRVGDQVTMAGGPCDGLVATIMSMDVKDRLVVLMNMLNRPVKVKVEARQVNPVLLTKAHATASRANDKCPSSQRNISPGFDRET